MEPVATPNKGYLAAAVALVALGGVVGCLLVGLDVKYTPSAEGSAFAVLYVLAQGVERVVEVVINASTLLPLDLAEHRKRRALAKLHLTVSGNYSQAGTTGDAGSAAESSAHRRELQQARLDIAVFAQAMAFALSFVLVSYLEIGIFETIGVEGMAGWVDRIFTALALMGGSKGLHDLIGKVQKSKEASEEGAAMG